MPKETKETEETKEHDKNCDFCHKTVLDKEFHIELPKEIYVSQCLSCAIEEARKHKSFSESGSVHFYLECKYCRKHLTRIDVFDQKCPFCETEFNTPDSLMILLVVGHFTIE